MAKYIDEIYVVEIQFLDGDKWIACADCALTMREAQAKGYEWAAKNPDAKFRVRKYKRIEVFNDH